MTFKVQVGPALMSIHKGHTILISEQDIGGQRGLYFSTRGSSGAGPSTPMAALRLPISDTDHCSISCRSCMLRSRATGPPSSAIHPRQRAAGLGGRIGCHADPSPLGVARCAAQ